jgi:hypothetical protein
LINSNPKDYKWKFNFVRILVLKRGKIPRGRAKAPKVVVPNITIDKSSLLTHLNHTRNSLLELENISKDHYFEHPFFGKIKRIRKKGIKEAELTLHVSAGTFQPIKVDNVLEHPMHSEQMEIRR